MNTRKNIDHTELFTALSSAVESELLHRIESAAHSEMALDTADEVCYTGENTETEGLEHDEDPLCVSGEHLPQPDGGVSDEGSGGDSRSVGTVPDRVCRDLSGRRTSQSTCRRETGRAWDQLRREILPPAGQADYDRFDLLIGMDNLNLVTMQYMFDNDPEGKLHRLLDYTGDPRNIEDPWYTRDFETAWQDIEKGCRGLLETLQNKGNDGC